MRTILAILTLAVCALPATAQSPGCPPSFCPAVDAANPDGIARLTLFPGTNSVISDNGPGDNNPACGIIEASNVPFPGAPYATGSALFSGKIQMYPATADNALAGDLAVTDAVISNIDAAGGGGGTMFVITSPLPLACGEFYWQNGPMPSALQVKIDGDVEALDDGSGATPTLAGFEELHVTARALSYTMVTPVSTSPPSELSTSVYGPNPGTASPHHLSSLAHGTGTFANGPGVIGLLLGGELPTNEQFRLPNSIHAGFGDIAPPQVPPMLVQKVSPASSSLLLSWDGQSCEGLGVGHSVLYGFGSQLPTSPGTMFQLEDAVCGLGPEQLFEWDPPPNPLGDPLLWWMVVSHGEFENEGAWGTDSAGAERVGPGPGGSSGYCGMARKAVATTCQP